VPRVISFSLRFRDARTFFHNLTDRRSADSI
jgi:hypothetical protein